MFQRFAGALRFRIELADHLDLVVEEIDAQRRLRAHREYVEQRSAQRELAGCADLRHRGIAGFHQPRAQRLDGQLVADREIEGPAVHVAARRDALTQRIGRGQQHRRLQPRQFGERREALGNDVGVRREQVVGQHFPVGQHMDRLGIAEEERELRAQLVQLARIARDDEVRAGVRFNGFGQRQAARGTIELVPALARLGGGNGWVEQGWHCESAAAYRPDRRSDLWWILGVMLRQVALLLHGCGSSPFVAAQRLQPRSKPPMASRVAGRSASGTASRR